MDRISEWGVEVGKGDDQLIVTRNESDGGETM